MSLPTDAALLAAVHACLEADAFVQAELGEPPRLLDGPPEDAVYPYLQYGDLRSEDASGDAAPLLSATLTLHVYSRYQGRAEAMNIVSTVLAALSRERLGAHLPGCVSVVSRYADSFRARDGQSRHTLLRLAITVEAPALEAA